MGRQEHFPPPAERLKEVTDKLEAGIKNLFESERYAAYLQAMSKFHRYSYGNIILILSQYPSASQVAGFRSWKKFGRSVKKGERGIQILAPCPYTKWERQDKTDPTTQLPVLDGSGQTVQEMVAVKKQGYKVEYVFDVTQTEGREMPSIHSELSGDVKQYDAICAALRDTSPVPIGFGPLPPGVYGSYSHLERRITIRPEMSQMQTLKTMIHEVAHSKLHALPVENDILIERPKKIRAIRELEAESVAYVVCQHFGIDTSEYSFGYIAEWARDRELVKLKASLDCIRGAAPGIIGSIEEKCPELAPPKPEPVKEEQTPRRSGQKRRSFPVR